MKQWSKIPFLIKMNFKNLFSNYMVLISMFILMVILSLVCTGLIREYEDKSSVPVGIIDEDNSELSKSVMEKLSNLEGILLVPGNREALDEKLRDEEIYAYFIINKGFETSVNACDYSKVVQMVYLGQNQFVSILSDIFAQAMMKDVVLKEGEKLYQTFKNYEDLIYKTDYHDFMEKKYANSEESFAFQYQYYNVTGKNLGETKAINNTLISTEMFLALGGIFLSFFIMQLLFCMDKKVSVLKRTHISYGSWWLIEVADLLTILIAEVVMTTLVTGYLFTSLSIELGSYLLSLMGLLLVFLLATTLLFVIFKKVISSKIIYQFVGFLIIFGLGGLSILMFLSQLKIDWMAVLAKKIPNYWFIDGITAIILGENVVWQRDIFVTLNALLILYLIITFVKYRKLEK